MSTTFFSKITLLPKDPIIGLTEDFNSDKRESKINLGVGVYLDSKGFHCWSDPNSQHESETFLFSAA